MNPKYDQTDPLSIEKYAQGLVGKSIKDVAGTRAITLWSTGGKGGLGQAVEEIYFDIHPGNSTDPDFKEAGVELKTFPLKILKGGKVVAKERISLGMIDYLKVGDEVWETSSLLRKNSLLLLLAYLYEQGALSYIDYVFKLAKLWRFPEEDLKIIRDDWEKVVSKIRAGKAHELSEGDTFYLGAVTKSQTSENRRRQNGGPDAKPRAFCLKQSYVNEMLRQISGGRGLLDEERIVKSVAEYRKGDTFESSVLKKFEPFLGKDIDDIHKEVGPHLNKNAKNYFAEVAKNILGVKKKKVEEFEKAGVALKTVRLLKNGSLKEDVSFPAFKYKELVNEEWETSTLKGQLERRFLFVVFQYNTEGHLILKRALFWTMPNERLEEDVSVLWEETVKRIKAGHADQLPRSTENEVVHVRPHGQNSLDKDETPNGKWVTKKCFWLNKRYLKKVLE